MPRRHILLAGVIAMLVVMIFLLAGAWPVGQNGQLIIFRTPAFLAVVAAACVLMLAACLLRRRPMRQAAFILTHAGLVTIVAGAVASWLAGRQYDGIRLPVAPGHAISALHDQAGNTTDLGFALTVTNFIAAHYDPVYKLYRPLVAEPRTADDYTYVQTIDPRRPVTLSHTPAGPIAPDLLRSGETWLPSVFLTNHWVLQRQAPVPSRFEATLLLTRRDQTVPERLAVNHPLRANGWRVYLVSWGDSPLRYVELAFRRDPGRPWIIGGIWCVMAGVTWLCLAAPAKGEAAHEPS